MTAKIITIRTVGNPALSNGLRDDIASETRHRSVGGVVKRLRQIDRDSDRWSACIGHWGSVEINVDGERLDKYDAMATDCDIDGGDIGSLKRYVERLLAT